ncbi:uncharacterized protein LOC127867049 isoform X2 [Dreissena polymorpha]|uniref:uncharacterized protein LOC127867049 isoform X2 n=1 Tax=Dreissena polymorpha TaxID=45954 RepID=UPI0022652537|nr:uncharacterized protein LOC127867049 isoform X2 [Dreissena polymorpha]
MRVIKSLVLRTRDLIPTYLYSLLWVIRQQTIIEKYYFLNTIGKKSNSDDRVSLYKGANTAKIELTETYSFTSVEIACTYESDTDVAVGYYKKEPSKSFTRTIAIGGNGTYCQMSPLRENIKCHCVNNRHVTCTLYNLTTVNEGEEWKCAIPKDGVGIYSNVARVSLQHSRIAEKTERTATGTIISFVNKLRTQSDANIKSARYSGPYGVTDADDGYYSRTELTNEFNETSTGLSADRVTELFSEDWTKISVLIASVIGSLIIVAAVSVPLWIRCRKPVEPSNDHMSTEEVSGPSSTIYHSIPPRFVDTADVRSLCSCYYVGCIAGTASQSDTHAINSAANVEDGTNQTEANGDTDHYSEIKEALNYRLKAGVLPEDHYSKCLEEVPDKNEHHYTESMDLVVTSQANHYMWRSTPASVVNKGIYAECMPNKVNSNKGAYVDIISRKGTEDKTMYAECMPNMMPANKASHLLPTETTVTYAECIPLIVPTDNIGYTDCLPTEMIANKRLYAECMPNSETLSKDAYAQYLLNAETADNSLYADCLPTENVPDIVQTRDQTPTFGTFFKGLSSKTNTPHFTSAVSCNSDVRNDKSKKRYKKKKPDENMYITAVYGPLPKW